MEVWVDVFAKHGILTYASAIACQILVALVSLVVVALTAYANVSAIVFLVGVQVDELIRKDASRAEHGIFDHLRAALGQGA